VIEDLQKVIEKEKAINVDIRKEFHEFRELNLG